MRRDIVYDSVARGGVGLFITESVAVDPLGTSGSPRMAIWDDSYISGQRRVVEAVHKYGTPVLAQIHHAGTAHSIGIYGAQEEQEVAPVTPVGPSTLKREELPGARSNLPRGLTIPEIKELVGKFVRAAERSQEEDSRRIAKLLEANGADFIHVSAFGNGIKWEWAHFPEQVLFPDAPEGAEDFKKGVLRGEALIPGSEYFKKEISIPVIGGDGMTFDSAERVLRQGRADLISFARPLIADPDLPIKLREGRVEDIRPCTQCMTCLDAFIRSEHEKCRVNVAFAKEEEMEITPASIKKRVLVVGGGPAGMEAARVAALREKENQHKGARTWNLPVWNGWRLSGKSVTPTLNSSMKPSSQTPRSSFFSETKPTTSNSTKAKSSTWKNSF